MSNLDNNSSYNMAGNKNHYTAANTQSYPARFDDKPPMALRPRPDWPIPFGFVSTLPTGRHLKRLADADK